MGLIMLDDVSIDKSSSLSVGSGALYSLVSIIMVFVVLLIIIGITSLVFKLMSLLEGKKEIVKEETVTDIKSVDTNDEETMAAILTATIEYRNEVKKDVVVKSVKRIK